MTEQKIYYLKTTDAISVIDKWLQTSPDIYWGKQPDEVKNEILLKSKDGIIKHQELTTILHSAKTVKLHSHANKGMDTIKDGWKKIKFN